MIAQPRGPAENKSIAGLEQHRLDWISSAAAAEKKARRIPERDGHYGHTRRQRGPAFVLVLMQSHPTVRIVVVENAEVGVETHADRPGNLGRQVTKDRGQRRDLAVVVVGAARLVLVALAVPVPTQA